MTIWNIERVLVMTFGVFIGYWYFCVQKLWLGVTHVCTHAYITGSHVF